MSEPIQMPNEIDKPDRMLMWSIDELIPVLALFGLGIVFGMLMYSLITIFIFLKFYRRFQEGSSEGFMYHFIWWFGFDGTSTKNIRNPFQKRYFP